MSTQCAVTSDLNRYEHNQAMSEAEEIAIAKEQLGNVEYAAKSIRAGHTIVDTRIKRVFDSAKKVYENKRVICVFGMSAVSDRVAEEITPQLCAGLLKSEPSALLQIQKIITEASLVVAFEALDLEDSPFIDFESLRITAGE